VEAAVEEMAATTMTMTMTMTTIIVAVQRKLGIEYLLFFRS
jgi:hypothetical protein